MALSIDDIFERWQREPSVPRTVELCEALRGSNREDLVDIVGSHATRMGNVAPVLAAARMYMDAGRLDEAQTTLIGAGKLAPRDGDIYRLLGEVLLRRGDAERAEKVFERAIGFGTTAPDIHTWLERARSLIPTQLAAGMQAVVDDVARQHAPGRAAPPPPRGRAPSVPDDIETQVRSVFQNVKWILEDSGSSWEKIVDVTVYLTNMKDDFLTYNRLWKEYFEKDPPCRTTLEINCLPTPIAIELKVVATV